MSFLDSAQTDAPVISVTGVPLSSRWYQELLGCESGPIGDEYERLVRGGMLVLQPHRFDVEHHHGRIAARILTLTAAIHLTGSSACHREP